MLIPNIQGTYITRPAASLHYTCFVCTTDEGPCHVTCKLFHCCTLAGPQKVLSRARAAAPSAGDCGCSKGAQCCRVPAVSMCVGPCVLCQEVLLFVADLNLSRLQSATLSLAPLLRHRVLMWMTVRLGHRRTCGLSEVGNSLGMAGRQLQCDVKRMTVKPHGS